MHLTVCSDLQVIWWPTPMFYFFLFYHTVSCTTQSSFGHQVNRYVATQNKTLKLGNINHNLHCKNSPVSAMRWWNKLHCVWIGVSILAIMFMVQYSGFTRCKENFPDHEHIHSGYCAWKTTCKNQQDIQLQKNVAHHVDYITDKELMIMA